MRIVDAHHHIWIPEQSEPDLGYGWLRDIGSIKPFGDPTAIQRDYPWAEYAGESQQHQLVGSVYLQCDGAISDPVAETAWVQSTIDRPKNQFGIVGLADLSAEHAQLHIEAQCQFESFRGVRQIISFLDDNPQLCFSSEHLLRNARWQDQFALIADNHLSFDLQLYPEQMLEAAEFFSAYPTVPIAIDHAGSPHDQSPNGMRLWQEGITALSELDNVCVKLCGFGMFDKRWSSDSIQPIVENLIDAFGAQRVMYGSNFPVDKLMAKFDATVERVLASVTPAGDDTVSAIFEHTAKKFYKLV